MQHPSSPPAGRSHMKSVAFSRQSCQRFQVLLYIAMFFAVQITLAYPSTHLTCSGGVEKRYFFTVCAVFKNEAVNMHEWISHYLLEGADHIFLVDNGSSDMFMTSVQPFIDSGQVTVMINHKQHAQQEILDHYILPILNVTEWMLNVDLDEIVYAVEGSTSEVLSTIPCSIATISVPWKMFGSSGHKQHPSGSLVKNFQRRSSAMKSANFKAFFRSSVTTKFHIHNAEVRGETLTLEIGTDCINNDGCVRAMHAGIMTAANVLQLNHYAIQSLQWFVKTKMSRGDATTAETDNVRTFGYFESYDAGSNQVEDAELYLKHQNFYDSL